MDVLIKKPNLLYMIFVRQCYTLKLWLRPLHRNKLIKAISICKIKSTITKWYIKPYNKLIKHREDGPAVISKNGGFQEWYINGQDHREDGPAIIYSSGTKIWCINGILHREDGPAIIRYSGESWYKYGNLHRDDGPAWIHDGEQVWYKNGLKVDPF